MTQSRLLLSFFALALLLAACNDPTFVGSDLLDEDALDIRQTDTVTLVTQTVREDSLAVWTDGTADLQSYFVGNFEDGPFGRTDAQLFTEVFTDLSPEEQLFTAGMIDSVIMRVQVIEDISYGDLDGTYQYDLYRVTEPMDRFTDYTAVDKFATEDFPIASTSFVPSERPDTTKFVAYPTAGNPDTIEIDQHLRFDLTAGLMDFLNTTEDEVFQEDSLFREAFNGLNIRPAAETPGLLALNFGAGNINTVVVYYTVDDVPQQYVFTLSRSGSVRVPNYVQDYTDSAVEVALETPGNDTLTFLQGLNGVLTQITFPYAEDFPERSQINRATLELHVNITNEDGTADLNPPSQLILAEVTDDGTRRTVPDLQAFLTSVSGILTFDTEVGIGFGGQLISSGDGPPLYRFNIPQHFAFMVRGEVSNVLELSQASKTTRARRLIIYGADHPEYAPRFTVTYTNY